jgi:hypothetical protein
MGKNARPSHPSLDVLPVEAIDCIYIRNNNSKYINQHYNLPYLGNIKASSQGVLAEINFFNIQRGEGYLAK